MPGAADEARSTTRTAARPSVAWILWLSLWLMAGCTADVAADLDERQAAEVLLALEGAGIDARRVSAPRPGSFRVEVPRRDRQDAEAVLARAELPRPDRGVAKVFADPGLLPSPAVERARLAAARAADLERTLAALPGVTAARVQLNLPAPDPLRADGVRPRPTAAVLLRTRGALAIDEARVRSLVAAAIEDLLPADVELLVASTEATLRAP